MGSYSHFLGDGSMMFSRTRRSLRDLVFGASLAVGMAGAACDEEQPIFAQPTGLPGAEAPQQSYLPECPLPSAVLNAFDSGMPLAEPTTLSGGLALPAGTRVVGLSRYLFHAYGPENTASCLDDRLPQSGATNLTPNPDCGCWPTAYSCFLDPEREPVPSWELLTGESFPELEYCDGQDNNCDGTVDDGFEPSRVIYCPDNPTIITSDEFKPSLCRLGTQYCIDGAFTECQDYIGPMENDPCNGLDDDCDRLIDEDDYGHCGYNDTGICQRGDNFCTEDAEMICLDAVWPAEEVCDGVDNDCDGSVDENLPEQLCYTGPEGTLNVGICRAGPQLCENSELVCYDTPPEEEICDGLDNNCDGIIDEGFAASCASCEPGSVTLCQFPERHDTEGNLIEQYDCGYGVRVCLEDRTWSPCEVPGDVVLQDEWDFLLCNLYDDDCDDAVDGTIDESGTFTPLTRECYDGPRGTEGVGICRPGQQICSSGTWTPPYCDEVLPDGNDYCGDGLDNNCDGAIDDYERRYGKLDIVIPIDVSGSMSTYIEAVTDALRQFLPTIGGEDHRFSILLFGHRNEIPGYGQGAAEMYLPLSSLGDAITALDELVSWGGHLEPSADVTYLLTDPSDPLGINWRADATPAIILLGDEEPQTNVDPLDGARPDAPLLPYANLEEARNACADNIYPCQLPGCNSATNEYWVDGDPVLVYFYVSAPFQAFWEPLGETYNIQDLVRTGTLSPNMAIAQELLCTEGEPEEGE